MKYDGLILDVDGTIWNTTEIVAEAWNKAIKELYPEVDLVTADILKKQFGKPMNVIADNLFSCLSDSKKTILLNRCCEEEQKAILSNKKDITYPAVIETIKELSDKIKLFIVSNCQSGYIEIVLEKNNMNSYITDFECYGNTGFEKDRNLKLLIERNNLKSPVYVGDTEGDYEACKKSGVPFIWASYGFGDLNENEYSVKIDTFNELKNIIL